MATFNSDSVSLWERESCLAEGTFAAIVALACAGPEDHSVLDVEQMAQDLDEEH